MHEVHSNTVVIKVKKHTRLLRAPRSRNPQNHSYPLSFSNEKLAMYSCFAGHKCKALDKSKLSYKLCTCDLGIILYKKNKLNCKTDILIKDKRTSPVHKLYTVRTKAC